MKVAIADHSPACSMRLGSLVAEIPCTKSIIHILDPQVAIEMVRTNSPDILIYDLHTGGKESMDLLKQLLEDLAVALIITLVDMDISYHKKRCNEIGITHCLNKALDFEEVPTLIKEYYGKNNPGCS